MGIRNTGARKGGAPSPAGKLDIDRTVSRLGKFPTPKSPRGKRIASTKG